MTITERIEELFDNGVINLTVGISPKKTRFVQIVQIVPTGPGTDHMQVQFQVEDRSLSEMLNTLKKQVDHTNQLKTNIVAVRNHNS